ncbi:MAG: outer membrane protein assembly factor BamA, partial [Candidatus Aminicenantes bacterium]|nr:outer membrane protein assembly factor BamA [Candidatus Aminicenantes bacterium]
MTKKSLLPFLLMGLFILPNLLLAQQPIIEKIVIVGNKRISSETVLYYISSSEGSPFDEERLERDFLSLWNTGFFDEVRILSEDGTQGKIVTFEVKEKMQLQEVVYKGNKSFSESDVTEKLDEQGISLKPGNYLDMGAVYNVMEVMRFLLADKGLQYPDIKYEITPVSETTVTLTFNVDEGDKARIEQIKFVGNKVYSDWALKHTIKKTRPHWFLSWASNSDLYSEERFSEDVARLTQFYWTNGFLRVKIDKPMVEVKIKKVGFFRRKESPRLFLTIPIEEGGQFRVGELEIKGNEVFTNEQLLFLAEMKKNDVCDITKVQKWKEAVEEVYGSRGYIMVSVLPSYNLKDEEKLCDISFTIEENDIYYVSKIEFLGNYNSRDWVLRRQLIMQEGQVFNKRILDLSVLRVQQLGFFDKVEPKNDILEEEKKVNVTLQLHEMGRNSVQFGGGYSALEGLFTNFAFETRNLLGRGQSVGVSGQ